jgi:DNA-binding transcriptional MocR family regulator
MELVTLNRRDALPLTDQIADELRKRIVQRALKPGSRLPSIRSFARSHGVSPFTVVEAYERLVGEGRLTSRHGSGFYISPPARVRRSHRNLELGHAQDTLWILRSLVQDRRGVLKAGAGWLPASWLDEEMVRGGLRALARVPEAAGGEYGDPHGFLGLREQVSRRLGAIGIEAAPGQVITTHGASHAIDLVGRCLVKPGDVVLVDDPGYYATFGYLKMLGATLVGVPRTPHGPDIAALEKRVAEHKPRLFFTMTVLHNPTGTSTSQAAAHQLLSLAEKHDFTVVENDTYGDFHPQPGARLAAMDQLNRVIYVSGFSKSLSPDLRVGYVACRQDLAEDLVDLKMLTGLATSSLNERLVAGILGSPQYERHLVALRERLARSRAATVKRLLASGLELFAPPEAGMFVLARLDEASNSAEVATLAAARDIILGPGHVFRPHHEPSPWLRFNVAFCDNPLLYRFLASMKRPARSRKPR